MMDGILDYVRLNWHMDHFSPERLRRYQEKQLFKLLDHSKKHSEFYKKQWMGKEIRSMKDFGQLPVINKQIMMEHFDELNTCGLRLSEVKEYALGKERNKDYNGYYKGRYVIGLSSGTSGNKGLYITPKAITRRLPAVFLARSGISLRRLPFRILFLLRVFSQGFADIHSPLIDLTYLSTMEPVDRIIRVMNEKKVNILLAPPSLLRLLIPYRDQIAAPLKIIVSCAEVLEKEEKQRLKVVFGTPVVEIYQASEGPIASPCRCGSLHINEDIVLVELYDTLGNPVEKADQVASRMLVTNLVNFAQPLIRYEMNDLIVLDEPCSCGSSFRVIKKVLGRNDDVIYLQRKNKELQHLFPDLMARWIITTSDNIREFKVIQNSPTTLEVILDLFDSAEPARKRVIDDLSLRIKEELSALELTADLSIRIERITLPDNRAKYKRFLVNPMGTHEPA